ncbi:phasin family protein [Bosea sp. 117]|uniref:phasin family protein n=1 Tax=Bosea sp. 117 TaxID=1125973 RepID=UPI000AD9A2FA|nr:phasin family protein [Bosea sp. 117]
MERSIEQARKALDGFMVAAHKALDDTEQRVGDLSDNARDLGRKTVGFAEANMMAGFDLAAKLATARTVEEWVKLQSEFALEQAKRLSDQAKVLGESGAKSFTKKGR